MNFKDFMNEVKLKLDVMDREAVETLVLEIARKMDVSKRSQFLKSFDKMTPRDLSQELLDAHILFDKIESGEIYFSAQWYETYEQYSVWGGDEHVDYSDPEGLGPLIEAQIKLICNLIDEKDYKQGLKLLDKIIGLTFQAYEEVSGDFYELTIQEAIDESLINMNLKLLCAYHAYSLYQLYSGKEQLARLCDVLRLSLYKNCSIEKMFSVGPEPLKGILQFVTEFSQFLREQEGERASSLLKETLDYVDVDLIDVARSTAELHPSMYLGMIENERDEEKYKIGLDALDNIPENLMIRSEIATILAKHYDEKGLTSEYGEMLKVIFLSKSTPYNSMQLFVGCSNEEIRSIYRRNLDIKVVSSLYSAPNEETATNYQTYQFLQIIKMFSGELDSVLRICDENSVYLGWSNNLLGLVVPLLLILLEKGFDEHSKAKERLITFVLTRLKMSPSDAIAVDFERVIQSCKEKLEFDSNIDELLGWLENHLIKRAEAVVGGGYRHSYYKVAELVVFYGEMLESYDKFESRGETIEKFRKLHYRKSAFKQELYNLM